MVSKNRERGRRAVRASIGKILLLRATLQGREAFKRCSALCAAPNGINLSMTAYLVRLPHMANEPASYLTAPKRRSVHAAGPQPG